MVNRMTGPLGVAGPTGPRATGPVYKTSVDEIEDLRDIFIQEMPNMLGKEPPIHYLATPRSNEYSPPESDFGDFVVSVGCFLLALTGASIPLGAFFGSIALVIPYFIISIFVFSGVRYFDIIKGGKEFDTERDIICCWVGIFWPLAIIAWLAMKIVDKTEALLLKLGKALIYPFKAPFKFQKWLIHEIISPRTNTKQVEE